MGLVLYDTKFDSLRMAQASTLLRNLVFVLSANYLPSRLLIGLFISHRLSQQDLL
jgi:hypothetical protein